MKLKDLPPDILYHIFLFDPTFRDKYSMVINQINFLPTYIQSCDSRYCDISNKDVHEFTYSIGKRLTHIFCSYECFMKLMFFYISDKYSKERELYSDNFNIYDTPHKYLCSEWLNFSWPINIFSTKKDINELL